MKLLITALCLAPVASIRAVDARDVPLGECYDCEVTCFEDCALKFDREIITPDNQALVQLSNTTANRVHFGWRTAKTPTKEDRQHSIDMADQYATCLKQEKCHGHPISPKSKKGVNSAQCSIASTK